MKAQAPLFEITQNSEYQACLPKSLRDIAELIGLPGALLLVKFWGGIQQLYIPAKIKPEHPLAQRLGFRAAKLLSKNYGSEYICVPRAAKALRAIRDAEIQKRYRLGKSAPLMAREYGLTERQIWTIIGQGESRDDRQAQLF